MECSFFYGNHPKTQNGGEQLPGNQFRMPHTITSPVVYIIMIADTTVLALAALENQDAIAKKLINTQMADEIANTTTRTARATNDRNTFPGSREILRAAITIPGSQNRAIDRYLPRKYPRKMPTTDCQERIRLLTP